MTSAFLHNPFKKVSLAALSAASASKTKVRPVLAIGLGNGGYQSDIGLDLVGGDGLVDLVVINKPPQGAGLVPIDLGHGSSAADSVKTAFRLGRKDALEDRGNGGVRNLRSSVGVTGLKSGYSTTERHPIPIRRHEYIRATRQKVSLFDEKTRKSVECGYEAFVWKCFIVGSYRPDLPAAFTHTLDTSDSFSPF